MLDWVLLLGLGFFGSFGHCMGMCGPLTVVFSWPQGSHPVASPRQQFQFHLLLNSGRIFSYVLVGAGIGALGSVLVAGGQVAGVGSGLRQGMAGLMGSLLVWFGLVQVSPGLLPQVPFLNPMGQGGLHDRLQRAMGHLSRHHHAWTPFLLGMTWGLIPCGFLYAAQLKAAETGSLLEGAATMLAFGLGTLPVMLGIGASASRVSHDRRSQLFRLGGWLTLLIGVLTLFRTGDTQVDYSGHGALLCLVLALIARPLSRVWPSPLRYRRVLGLGAFLFSLMHLFHNLDHSWNWNWRAIAFMLPQHQWGIVLGFLALGLMTPAAGTSFDRAQKALGSVWRGLHLLSLPALVLAGLHTILLGSHYAGTLQVNGKQIGAIVGLTLVIVGVFLVRWRGLWFSLGLGKWYGSRPENPG